MPGWNDSLVMGILSRPCLAKTRTVALLNSRDMPQMFTKNTISIRVNNSLFEVASMAYSELFNLECTTKF